MDSKSILQGNIILQLNDPLSSQKIPIENLEHYIEENNSILIYLDDDPMPYLMKRTYFINLLFDDYDYKCNVNNKIVKPYKQYYNLGKLFLNVKENPDIIVLKSQLDEVIRRDTTKFKLSSTGKTITTYPQINHNLTKYVEYPKFEKKKWSAVANYTSEGYAAMNEYLIRLADYKHNGYTLADILKVLFSDIGSIFGLKKIPKIETRKQNMIIESYIYNLDYLFYKHVPRSDGKLVLYRGIGKFRPALKNIGDKMVFENYTSTTDSLDNVSFGNVVYEIIVAKGVPYIDTTKSEISKYIKYPEEREFLLPRNLVAELVETDIDIVIHEIPKKMNRIILRPMNDEQFDIVEKKCSKHNVYKIQIFDENDVSQDYSIESNEDTVRDEENNYYGDDEKIGDEKHYLRYKHIEDEDDEYEDENDEDEDENDEDEDADDEHKDETPKPKIKSKGGFWKIVKTTKKRLRRLNTRARKKANTKKKQILNLRKSQKKRKL
jgi:hypothetical protein